MIKPLSKLCSAELSSSVIQNDYSLLSVIDDLQEILDPSVSSSSFCNVLKEETVFLEILFQTVVIHFTAVWCVLVQSMTITDIKR